MSLFPIVKTVWFPPKRITHHRDYTESHNIRSHNVGLQRASLFEKVYSCCLSGSLPNGRAQRSELFSAEIALFRAFWLLCCSLNKLLHAPPHKGLVLDLSEHRCYSSELTRLSPLSECDLWVRVQFYRKNEEISKNCLKREEKNYYPNMDLHRKLPYCHRKWKPWHGKGRTFMALLQPCPVTQYLHQLPHNQVCSSRYKTWWWIWIATWARSRLCLFCFSHTKGNDYANDYKGKVYVQYTGSYQTSETLQINLK